MPDYLDFAVPVAITSLGRFSPMARQVTTRVGGALTSVTSNQANRASYYPIYLPFGCTATRLWWINGATASGNVDIGIYDREGNRLVATGSTAQGSTNSIQLVDITDQPLSPGWYYLAIAFGSATATAYGTANIGANAAHALGIAQEASAFPLPSTATFGAPTTTRIFQIGMTTGRIV
jgi:hypothetical protein